MSVDVPAPAGTPLPVAPALLVDASSYLFRAWFGVPDAFHDRRGRPLNAVVGFARTLGMQLRAARPAWVGIAFDGALFSGFRHRLDPGYKANRALPPRDLAFQMQACRRLAEGLGLVAADSPEFEADDLLATWSARLAGRCPVVIVSEDKDLAQLLDAPDRYLWQHARGRLLDAPAAEGWLGIAPCRLPELQALTGDAGDGIPGIPGFGPRSARAVLAAATLPALLRDPARVGQLPLRGAARLATALAEGRARARLNFRLATLHRRATGLPPRVRLGYRPPAADDVRALVRDLGLPPGTARHFIDLPVAGDARC